METNKPYLLLVSGPNGAGKTTFYNTVIKQNRFFKDTDFINQDIEFADIVAKPENAQKLKEEKYDISSAKKFADFCFYYT